MKKYIYHAPKHIRHGDPQTKFLKEIDGKYVKIEERIGEYALVSRYSFDYPVFKVFFGDLEEIKYESVSAEAYSLYILELDKASQSYKEVLDDSYLYAQRKARLDRLIKRAVVDGVEKGRGDERLRHRPKQSFDEWWAEIDQHSRTHYDEGEFRWVWTSCREMHNLER